MDESNIVNIEICTNCKFHQWCTRHDEAKYQKNFELVKAAILQRNPNLQVVQHIGQIGAFEISISGHLIYSKVHCSLWPNPELVSQRVINFIDDFKNNNDLTKYSNLSEKPAQSPKKKQLKSTYPQCISVKDEKKTVEQKQNNLKGHEQQVDFNQNQQVDEVQNEEFEANNEDIQN